MTELLYILFSLVSINAVRIDAGLMPVAWKPELALYAANHATTMADAGVLEHSTELGTLLPGRSWLGENVGRCNCGHVPLQAYLDSPSHAANVLSPRATSYGTAEVHHDGNTYDVQIFAQDSDAITLPRYAVLYEGEGSNE